MRHGRAPDCDALGFASRLHGTMASLAVRQSPLGNRRSARTPTPNPFGSLPSYLDPYRQSHQRHGSTFDVTLWASPRTQQRRFEVFTQVARLQHKSLLDLGCSRGDLAQYLLDIGLPFESYLGIDALAEVIDFASARQLPRCRFVAGDPLADPDLLRRHRAQVVCVSGTLNTMSEADAFRFLEQAWSAADESLLFNFLSDRASLDAVPQLGPARRLPALRLLDWALSHTSQVGYRQDYFRHGHDATILMRRGHDQPTPGTDR